LTLEKWSHSPVATIDALIALAASHRCVFLRGNQDAVWLETWNGSAYIRCPHIPEARQIWERYIGLAPPSIGAFLTRTCISYEDGYAWYSHAGAKARMPFWESPPEVYVWGTPSFLSSSYGRNKPVIFGHYELDDPLISHTKIGLDTGAWGSGVLTGLRVGTVTIIQAFGLQP
jgi:serine/threonine protein phosphatase 1